MVLNLIASKEGGGTVCMLALYPSRCICGFVFYVCMYVCMYVYVCFVLQGPTFGTPSGPGGGGLVEEFSVPAPKCGVIIGRGKFYVCVAYSSSLVGDYVVFVLL